MICRSLCLALSLALATPATALAQDDDWGRPPGPPKGGIGARVRAGAKAPPPGFEVARPPAGGGEALFARRAGAPSARALLFETLDALAPYFGERPRVTEALADGRDQAIEARIEAPGAARAGVVLCYAGPQGFAAIVHDRREDLARSLPELAQLLAPHLPQQAAPRPEPLNWRVQQLEDGSGTIRTPDGWAVSTMKTMVSGHGPQGNVDLGISATVMTPEAAAQAWARPPLVAPYVDPERALVDLFPQIMGPVLPAARFGRVVEKSPAQYPNGQAAWIRYQWIAPIDGAPTSIDTIALVVMAPVGGGSWMYYTSSVTTTTEKLGENLPVLLEIWRSWKISDHVFQERLNEAMKTMRETNEIMSRTAADRSHGHDVANAKWSEYWRGERTMRDERGMDRDREVPYQNLDKVIEERNRQEGWQRWRIVPQEELIRR